MKQITRQYNVENPRKRIDLKNVCLFGIDTQRKNNLLHAALRCIDVADFGEVVLLWEGPIKSKGDYSRYILTELADKVHMPHVLIIQWDGFIVNPDAWNPEFLKYDYIGAPWWYQDGNNVGNGGFSLRSHKFIKACQDPRIRNGHPEDDFICRGPGRRILETEYSIRFAPEKLAHRFSWEKNGKYPYYDYQFGFHGAHEVPLFII